MKTYPKLSHLIRTLSQAATTALGLSLANPGAFAAEAPPPAAPAQADASKADEKADPKAEVKSDSKAEDKAESKPEAKDEEKEKSGDEEKKEFKNWFDLTVGGAILDGDKAAFQRRYGLPAGPFGGVESFHYEEDIGKKGVFKVDGRGLFDNHDYSLKFDVEHPDIGYIRGGYTEFRSYFDGSGGYFPATGAWVSPFDDDLALDRGEAFFEAGLTLPKKPVITFRYSHQFRYGEKDSTSWGDLAIPGYGVRKVVPGFRSIDETRDTFELDARHTLGSTTFGLGLRYENWRDENAANLLRNPDQASAQHVTTRERVDADLFNVHAFSETRFNDKFLFTSGYSFTTLDTDLSGYRLYGSAYDPAFAQRLPAADTFENLSGGAELKQHVANLNLPIQLADSLLLVPSIRIEKEETDSESSYGSPAAPFSSSPYGANSERGLLDVTERIELRYTGVTNWVFYTRGEWMEGSGDLRERWDNLGTGANVVDQSTDNSRFWQTYTIGANWYPLRRLNFGAQYYHKERWNDYDHHADSTPNAITSIPTFVYPAFLTAQDWTTDDANFRVTWRPLPNLTLVGRYDFQLSTIDTEPDNASGLSAKQTAKMTSQIFGGTVSWTPLQRLYLQLGANVVFDQTDTPADEVTEAIQRARNDYWTANSSIGYALDNKTDLELQYFYYRADDRLDNSAYGLPYGSDAQEHGVTAAIIRRITDRIRVTLKYGFFDGRDWTSGEHNNYQAHLVYSSLHYRF